MIDNNYKPMPNRNVRKIPRIITDENKVWVDLRTLLYAFLKKIYELYFCKGIFRKKKSPSVFLQRKA